MGCSLCFLFSRCVCGKVVKLCSPYYWKYLIQKPTVKNGTVIQKGHWFACAEVSSAVSVIKPWVITPEEVEASKVPPEEKTNYYGKQQQQPSSLIQEGKRRRSSGLTSKLSTSDSKKAKPCREESEEEEASDEEEESHGGVVAVAAPKRDYFSMYR